MISRRIPLLLLAWAFAIGACGDDASPPTDGREHDGGGAGAGSDGGDEGCPPPRVLDGETPLPAEIADILERRCWFCHDDPTDMFAPMSIVTWEQAQAPRTEGSAEPVYGAIERRIHDARFPMPPVTFEQLTDAERDTFDAWFEQCAPPGP